VLKRPTTPVLTGEVVTANFGEFDFSTQFVNKGKKKRKGRGLLP
jgi:hypothetical protein